jgi:hypothetical protein
MSPDKSESWEQVELEYRKYLYMQGTFCSTLLFGPVPFTPCVPFASCRYLRDQFDYDSERLWCDLPR